MVLLVVDAQNGIVDERLYEFRKFVGNIKKLIGAAREQGIEVIYVQHDDGPDTGFSIGEAGFEHGLHMIVPAYANSTQDNEYMTREQAYHYYNEFLWPERYADCVPMDRALELLKK